MALDEEHKKFRWMEFPVKTTEYIYKSTVIHTT